MSVYQTQAIVLRREDIFEADRIYHLYTEEFGKARVLAGSVRKINAKLTGHLEPFNLIWVEIATKKNGDFFITTALSEKSFLSDGLFPQRIGLLTKMSDFSLMMLRGPEKDEALWNFTLEMFSKAGAVEAGNFDAFLNEYKSGFAKIMGFGDNFDEARYYLGDFGVL